MAWPCPGSAQAWAELAGANPKTEERSFEKLLETDDGWLASYFDALSRIDGPTAAYLDDPERMKKVLLGFEGKDYDARPARPGFPGRAPN